MDYSSFAPDGLVALGVAAATIGYAIRSWGSTQPVADDPLEQVAQQPSAADNGVAPPAIVPAESGDSGDGTAIVPAPVVGGTMALVAPPVGGNVVNGSDATGTVPMFVVPPAAAVAVVSYLGALSCFNALMANVFHLVLVDLNNVNAPPRRRIYARMTDMGVMANWVDKGLRVINEIRMQVVGHGMRLSRDDPNFNADTLAIFANSRMMDKIWQRVNLGVDPRWRARMVVSSRWVVCGCTVIVWLPRRRGNGASYPIYQYGTIRTDVSWTIYYFLIIRGLLLLNGATVEQAEYVGCSAVVELVGAAYGQPAGMCWGLDATDFGFTVPATLPHY